MMFFRNFFVCGLCANVSQWLLLVGILLCTFDGIEGENAATNSDAKEIYETSVYLAIVLVIVIGFWYCICRFMRQETREVTHPRNDHNVYVIPSSMHPVQMPQSIHGTQFDAAPPYPGGFVNPMVLGVSHNTPDSPPPSYEVTISNDNR